MRVRALAWVSAISSDGNLLRSPPIATACSAQRPGSGSRPRSLERPPRRAVGLSPGSAPAHQIAPSVDTAATPRILSAQANSTLPLRRCAYASITFCSLASANLYHQGRALTIIRAKKQSPRIFRPPPNSRFSQRPPLEQGACSQSPPVSIRLPFAADSEHWIPSQRTSDGLPAPKSARTATSVPPLPPAHRPSPE